MCHITLISIRSTQWLKCFRLVCNANRCFFIRLRSWGIWVQNICLYSGIMRILFGNVFGSNGRQRHQQKRYKHTQLTRTLTQRTDKVRMVSLIFVPLLMFLFLKFISFRFYWIDNRHYKSVSHTWKICSEHGFCCCFCVALQKTMNNFTNFHARARYRFFQCLDCTKR